MSEQLYSQDDHFPEKSAKYSEINFSKALLPKDIKLIIAQCENQHAISKEQLEGFAVAYLMTKKLSQDKDKLLSFSQDDIEDLILQLAVLIEPEKGKKYRNVPVRFSNQSSALDPQLIEQAMKSYCEAYTANRLEPEEAFREFEKIHPFMDGNGRVGDLLWKLACVRKTGHWPEELPPKVFT